MELDKELQSHDEVKQLAAALGVDKEEEIHLALSRYTRWQRIFIILLAWQKNLDLTKPPRENFLVFDFT